MDGSKRNTSSSKCSEETIQKCIRSIKEGRMTVYKACKTYGTPMSTIRYRISGSWQNKYATGPRSILTEHEEEGIVRWLVGMQERGFPVTRAALVAKVTAFLVSSPRQTPFKSNIPGIMEFSSLDIPIY